LSANKNEAKSKKTYAKTVTLITKTTMQPYRANPKSEMENPVKQISYSRKELVVMAAHLCT
jgi:hypothetical protein